MMRYIVLLLSVLCCAIESTALHSDDLKFFKSHNAPQRIRALTGNQYPSLVAFLEDVTKGNIKVANTTVEATEALQKFIGKPEPSSTVDITATVKKMKDLSDQVTQLESLLATLRQVVIPDSLQWDIHHFLNPQSSKRKFQPNKDLLNDVTKLLTLAQTPQAPAIDPAALEELQRALEEEKAKAFASLAQKDIDHAAAIEALLTSKEAELEALRNQLAQGEITLAEKGEELKILRTLTEQQKTDLDAMKASLAQNEEALKGLAEKELSLKALWGIVENQKTELKKHQDKMAESAADLKIKEEELRNLRASIDSQKADMDSLRKELAQGKAALDALQQEKDQLKRENDLVLEGFQKRAQQELKELREKLEQDLRQALAELEGQKNSEMDAALAALRAKLEGEHTTALAQLGADKELEKEILRREHAQQLEDALEALRKEKETDKAEALEKLRNERMQANAEAIDQRQQELKENALKDFQAQIERAQQDALADHQRRHEEAMATIRTDLNRVTSVVDSLKADNAEQQAMIAGLQEELRTANALLASYSQQPQFREGDAGGPKEGGLFSSWQSIMGADANGDPYDEKTIRTLLITGAGISEDESLYDLLSQLVDFFGTNLRDFMDKAPGIVGIDRDGNNKLKRPLKPVLEDLRARVHHDQPLTEGIATLEERFNNPKSPLCTAAGEVASRLGVKVETEDGSVVWASFDISLKALAGLVVEEPEKALKKKSLYVLLLGERDRVGKDAPFELLFDDLSKLVGELENLPLLDRIKRLHTECGGELLFVITGLNGFLGEKQAIKDDQKDIMVVIGAKQKVTKFVSTTQNMIGAEEGEDPLEVGNNLLEQTKASSFVMLVARFKEAVGTLSLEELEQYKGVFGDKSIIEGLKALYVYGEEQNILVFFQELLQFFGTEKVLSGRTSLIETLGVDKNAVEVLQTQRDAVVGKNSEPKGLVHHLKHIVQGTGSTPENPLTTRLVDNGVMKPLPGTPTRSNKSIRRTPQKRPGIDPNDQSTEAQVRRVEAVFEPDADEKMRHTAREAFERIQAEHQQLLQFVCGSQSDSQLTNHLKALARGAEGDYSQPLTVDEYIQAIGILAGTREGIAPFLSSLVTTHFAGVPLQEGIDKLHKIAGGQQPMLIQALVFLEILGTFNYVEACKLTLDLFGLNLDAWLATMNFEEILKKPLPTTRPSSQARTLYNLMAEMKRRVGEQVGVNLIHSHEVLAGAGEQLPAALEYLKSSIGAQDPTENTPGITMREAVAGTESNWGGEGSFLDRSQKAKLGLNPNKPVMDSIASSHKLLTGKDLTEDTVGIEQSLVAQLAAMNNKFMTTGVIKEPFTSLGAAIEFALSQI